MAELHAHALNWSINGRMGIKHLSCVYALLLDGADIIGFASEHQGRLVAFQVSTTDWRMVRKRLSRLPFMRKLRVFLSCLFHPSDLIVIFETMFYVPKIFSDTDISAELIAWIAEPGNFLASLSAHQCLMRSLAELKVRGHERCLGQFQKPNPRPQAYLQKLGYDVVARLRRNDIFIVRCNAGAIV